MSKRILVAVGLALTGILVVSTAQQNKPNPYSDSPEFSLYHIVYFTHGQDENEFMAPAKIQEAPGAELAGSWSEVIEAHDREPLDALIIHANAISEVDPNQLRAMYQNGVVLAFFNTYSPAIVELTNDSGIGQDDWMDGTAEPMNGNFYVVVSQLILCRDGEIAELDGGPACEISSASKSKSADSLDDAAHFDQFLHVLLIDIQSMQEWLQETETE